MVIAEALWQYGEHPIAKALMAKRLFLKMAMKYKESPSFDDHIHVELMKNSR